MIGLPFNDLACLGWVTQVVAEMVANPDQRLVALASAHPSACAIQAYIRALPQRDDTGDPSDGPRLQECDPPQRLDLFSAAPNCFERSALYMLLAELVDPKPTRQLATVRLGEGALHTFPLVDGAPVVLDPNESQVDLEQALRATRAALEAGEGDEPRNAAPSTVLVDPDVIADLHEHDDHATCVALERADTGPMPIGARDALALTTQLGIVGAAQVRNGSELGRAHRARDTIMRLVDEGVAPETEHEIDLVAWLLALAEQVAVEQHNSQTLAIVRATANGLASLADQAIDQLRTRNLSLNIGGYRLSPASWLGDLAGVAARVGGNVGAVALRAKLASMGVGPDLFGLLEDELNRDGYSLGALANPRQLPSLDSMFADDAPAPPRRR